MQCLIRMDRGEGLVEGAQHNTLDQPWFGKVAWLSSLYLAALRACEEMAREVGDAEFAKTAREIFDRGSRNLDRELFNGEYYYQIPDKDHVRSVGSHNGCEIDQVFGQSWAFQVGLGRILPEGNVKKALASLWKYNFAPDVGPFRKAHKPGRWYAMAGEAGLIMCTWPQGEAARAAARIRLLLQRVHERLRVPGGRPHDLGGHGPGGAGRDPRDPRPLSSLAPQSLERGRVRRPLRPLDGQLRRLPGGLRLRVSRAEAPPGLCPAAIAGEFPRRLHHGRGLGNVLAEGRRRPPQGRVAVRWGKLALKTLGLAADGRAQSRQALPQPWPASRWKRG